MCTNHQIYKKNLTTWYTHGGKHNDAPQLKKKNKKNKLNYYRSSWSMSERGSRKRYQAIAKKKKI